MRLLPIVVSVLFGVAARSNAQCGWVGLGPGTNERVNALKALPNGDLVAGGNFTASGPMGANRIARWTGGTWSALGTGMNGEVRALAVLPSGELVAGGDFTRAGGATVNGIARWNGTTWSSLQSGMGGNDPAVYSLAVLPNGHLVAGGSFTTSGGISTNHIAVWNGTAWSSLGSGTGGRVDALAVLSSGELVAGGIFSDAGSVPAAHIARWNGSAWSAVGGGMNSVVASLAVLSDGDLVAGGSFTTAGGATVNNIARWNGATWESLGSGMGVFNANPDVLALAVLPGDILVAGGRFTTAGGVGVNRIARWNGTTWSGLDNGVTGLDQYADVGALEVLSDGDLAAGGLFAFAGGTGANNVAVAHMQDVGQIVQHPTPVALVPGTIANFQVSASGTGTLAYQWRRNGVDLVNGARITGADAAALSIANVTSADQGHYDCSVTSDCGAFDSRPAALSCVPIITQQPVPFRRLTPAMQLSVAVPVGASYAYRWRQNGQNLFNIPGLFSGVTNRTLTIQGSDASLAGLYDCVLTNICGTVMSAVSQVPCLSDFNLDASVDGDDVIAFFAQWDASTPSGDINGDGGVDGDDVIAFFGAWDTGC